MLQWNFILCKALLTWAVYRCIHGLIFFLPPGKRLVTSHRFEPSSFELFSDHKYGLMWCCIVTNGQCLLLRLFVYEGNTSSCASVTFLEILFCGFRLFKILIQNISDVNAEELRRKKQVKKIDNFSYWNYDFASRENNRSASVWWKKI